MKFFIASPFRNKDTVKDLEETLKLRGHSTYSFLDSGANLCTGDGVADEFKIFGHSMVDWEDSPLVAKIFDSEMQALQSSDALILLEPSGLSSLAEAGIAYGMGKKVILIGFVDHPEVVYRMFGARYPTVNDFLASSTRVDS